MDFIDRSRFMDREILDPAHVMEHHISSAAAMGRLGEHTEGGLMEALKKGEVDLGVSTGPRCTLDHM